MKTRHLLYVAMALCCCIFLAIKHEKNQSLVGLWKIHIIETQDSSGAWVPSSWMKNGKAFLHYATDSTMSLHFTPYGYENAFSSDSLMQEAYWYLAKYRVLRDKHTVVHTRIMHSDPSEWGRSVEREFRFEEDTLILFPKEYNLRLKWVKV